MPIQHWKDYYTVMTSEGPVVLSVRYVNSTNLKWVGWPRFGSQKLMFVEFKDGSRYMYAGVSRQRAYACAQAESSGSYLNDKIKPYHEVLKLR